MKAGVGRSPMAPMGARIRVARAFAGPTRRPPRPAPARPRARPAPSAADVERYNKEMAERMGWANSRQGLSPYEYHPERGARKTAEGVRGERMGRKLQGQSGRRLQLGVLLSGFLATFCRARGDDLLDRTTAPTLSFVFRALVSPPP